MELRSLEPVFLLPFLTTDEMMRAWTVRLQQWRQLPSITVVCSKLPTQLIKEKKCVVKVLYFLRRTAGWSVKNAYLVEHTSSHELCTIMINTNLKLGLDTVVHSHGELSNAKCPVIYQFSHVLTWIKCCIKCLS